MHAVTGVVRGQRGAEPLACAVSRFGVHCGQQLLRLVQAEHDVTGGRAVLSRVAKTDTYGKVMVMRVFVAGGTGVLGRRLVPQLLARGHQVTATTTSAAKLGLLADLGADGVVMDGLDAASVGEAVAKAQPEVIVHQMTGLSLTQPASST